VKPDVAVGVAVPFAVAVQMGITFLFSVMSGVMSRCDRMAANADTRGIERVNYLALLALGVFYFSVLSCQSISARNMRKPPLMSCLSA
jgi:PTS system N-acetylgalactosamine-specific IIC component